MSAQKGAIQSLVLTALLVLFGLGLFFISGGKIQPPNKNSKVSTPASPSAKGVIMIQTPTKGQEIRPPLTVTGLVYGNNGTLTIKLKQKESGMYVTEDKVVKISGKSDNISFAEAMMFGLPAMPQPGILEVSYKDDSDQGLDDKVSIEVNFPSDLGRGE